MFSSHCEPDFNNTSSCSSPLPTSGMSAASTSTLFLLEVREEEEPVNWKRPSGLTAITDSR
ncbi:hypothetical protein INR49_008589 [Caranx melampygus]|nr:hypothetical protein INR49_008589 [Caranx melampygus]